MKKLDELTELICDLYWEYDRMSSSGQETLDKMADILGVSLGTEKTYALPEDFDLTKLTPENMFDNLVEVGEITFVEIIKDDSKED